MDHHKKDWLFFSSLSILSRSCSLINLNLLGLVKFNLLSLVKLKLAAELCSRLFEFTLTAKLINQKSFYTLSFVCFVWFNLHVKAFLKTNALKI